MLITTASCLSIVFTVDEDSLKVFSMEEQFLKSGHPVASYTDYCVSMSDMNVYQKYAQQWPSRSGSFENILK